MKKQLLILLLPVLSFVKNEEPQSWIRINQLGYTPGGVKVAVWCSKEQLIISNWQLVDAHMNKIAFAGKEGKAFGSYGPFKQSYRLDFSSFKKPGRYYLQVGETRSPEFEIGNDVYKGAADFCLRYMRQQRSGFNPFLKDSCHTHDGYTLYGPMPDSMHIDVVGGWHDASDYLQYSATSANATYHLLMAYRDFPTIFSDKKLANGLDGSNGLPDVLDEAKWGLDWLMKMYPDPNWMFNQVGDDRDHQGMRIPKEDSFYGKGYERPVYFINGKPQQRGKFLNNTTGISSTAGKFASAFALAYYLCRRDSLLLDNKGRKSYYFKSYNAYSLGLARPGATQTVSVRSPYIYAEDNWVDDLELAAAAIANVESQKVDKQSSQQWVNRYLNESYSYAKQEPVTPWLGADTAKHYQWYPFINIGHYELAKQLTGKRKDTIISYYKEGIQRVWKKARQNAFYRGIPFIWCSNNLTVSFAIQCYWYRQLTKDKTFTELEQANFDWIFGCNPWGTSFVYGLPASGDTPVDPHSAFTHLKNYPIDGGLVDGPVYTSIYKNLIGIKLYKPDEYAAFQSDLAVYHDDYGDYSTNEPTMDGTASLIYLLAAETSPPTPSPKERGPSKTPVFLNLMTVRKPSPSERVGVRSHGAIIRGDSTQKKIALVFTGDEFADGGMSIAKTLKQEQVKASFFFTGRFYRNEHFQNIIQQLRKDGNYLGPHSDQHLLYCDWNKRDSLLVSKEQFTTDLLQNYEAMKKAGINAKNAHFFLPPYEWYNDSIASWTGELGLQLINFTPGTRSNADYTFPGESNYQSSDSIYDSILNFERSKPSGLNGFILLLHIGTDSRRTDKMYTKLPELLKYLKAKGYQFQIVTNLLGN